MKTLVRQTEGTTTQRWYVRCIDCLSPLLLIDPPTRRWRGAMYLADAALNGLVCPHCGGRIEEMGRVVGGRVRADEVVAECDGRCTGASGPDCNCACGGANHGSHLTRVIHRDEGDATTIETEAAQASRARADETHAALAAVELRIAAADVGHVWERKAQGEYLSSADFRAWLDIRDMRRAVTAAEALRTHKGRLRALARIGTSERSISNSIGDVAEAVLG